MKSWYEFKIKFVDKNCIKLVKWIMTVGTTNSTNCQTASETATDLCKWFPWSFSIFTLNIQNERRKCFHLHVVDLWRIEQFTDISPERIQTKLSAKIINCQTNRTEYVTCCKIRNQLLKFNYCAIGLYNDPAIIDKNKIIFTSNPCC